MQRSRPAPGFWSSTRTSEPGGSTSCARLRDPVGAALRAQRTRSRRRRRLRRARRQARRRRDARPSRLRPTRARRRRRHPPLLRAVGVRGRGPHVGGGPAGGAGLLLFSALWVYGAGRRTGVAAALVAAAAAALLLALGLSPAAVL